MRDGDITQQSEKDFESILDEKVATSNTASSLKELDVIVGDILATLPRINRQKLRQEMETMSVRLEDNPTTSQLNEGLARAQGYKDRLAEIYTYALREFKTRNRCMEMLFDAVNYVSTAKSADKRKGEATMLYPMYIIQREAAETFVKEVEHVLQNIKSAHDSISRQVSIAQIQVQLGELRRGETPSYPKAPNQAEEVSANTKSGEIDWGSF